MASGELLFQCSQLTMNWISASSRRLEIDLTCERSSIRSFCNFADSHADHVISKLGSFLFERIVSKSGTCRGKPVQTAKAMGSLLPQESYLHMGGKYHTVYTQKPKDGKYLGAVGELVKPGVTKSAEVRLAAPPSFQAERAAGLRRFASFQAWNTRILSVA